MNWQRSLSSCSSSTYFICPINYKYTVSIKCKPFEWQWMRWNLKHLKKNLKLHTDNNTRGRGFLNCNDFSRFHFDSEEERVILDVASLSQRLMRNEAWESKAEWVGLFAWTLEILPSGIRIETFRDVEHLRKEREIVFCIVDCNSWNYEFKCVLFC